MSKRIKAGTVLKKDNIDNFIIDGHLLTKPEAANYVFSDQVDFELPKTGGCLHYITNRAFNAIEIIEKVAQGEVIEEMCVAVYSINEKAGSKIMALHRAGRIKKASFIFSTIRRGGKGNSLESTYKTLQNYGAFNICYLYSHAKVVTIKTKSSDYTLEMSCNLAHNSRIENIVIFNSAQLLDFHSSWIKSLMEAENG